MAEQIDLTTPIASTGGTSYWRVRAITLWYQGVDSYIKVNLFGENGEKLTVGYEGTTAETLIKQLNIANLSGGESLHFKIIERLEADGKIGNGTISGTPDT